MTTSYVYKIKNTSGQVYVSCELNQPNTGTMSDPIRRKFKIDDYQVLSLELFPTAPEALTAEELLYKSTFEIA